MTKLTGALDAAWICRLKQALAAALQPPGAATKPAAGKSSAGKNSLISPAPAPAKSRDTSERGQHAIDCHRSAETHINAALYELDRLRDEVAAVLAKSPEQLQNSASPASQRGRPSKAA